MADLPVVSNTSPLITLAGVGLLDLLPAIYGEIWIAQTVQSEYQFKALPTDPELGVLPWLVVKTVAPDPIFAAIQGLGRGEADTITLAQASQARAVLIDDKLGRRVATQHGLPVIGTMTTLLRAKQQGLLPAVMPVVDTMIAQGRRISAALRAHVCHVAGEDSPT